ncbi:hypothetical protein HY635_02355 [Candidatus Uhrbacteria bacterium]|nr:hypothetical protein [Candidatus Uhrbacteria bacterium]
MLGYWFSLTPPSLSMVHQRLWGGIAAACIIAALLVRRLLIRRLSKRFLQQPWQRLARLLAWTGIILLVLLFFRYEGVPFFGARFWILLLALGDLAWFVVIIRGFLKVPVQKRAWEQEQTRRRYLK